jgi:hypothetical protein
MNAVDISSIMNLKLKLIFLFKSLIFTTTARGIGESPRRAQAYAASAVFSIRFWRLMVHYALLLLPSRL